MIASHVDFCKSSELMGSPGLIQLTQNQIQKLFRSLFTTKHFHHPPEECELTYCIEREKMLHISLQMKIHKKFTQNGVHCTGM